MAELLGPRFRGTRLGEHAACGALFGLRLLGLELEIDLVERSERLAGIDQRADLDQPLQDLAADAKSKVAFDARADGADEGTVARLRLVVDSGHQHGPDRRRSLRGDLVTAGERQSKRTNRCCFS